VAASTDGQRTAAELVVHAAEAITRVARQNVASVEEIAASARSLRESAEALDVRIRVFKVEATVTVDDAGPTPSGPRRVERADVPSMLRPRSATAAVRPSAAAMVSAT
jgi:hypothetical protein